MSICEELNAIKWYGENDPEFYAYSYKYRHKRNRNRPLAINSKKSLRKRMRKHQRNMANRKRLREVGLYSDWFTLKIPKDTNWPTGQAPYSFLERIDNPIIALL